MKRFFSLRLTVLTIAVGTCALVTPAANAQPVQYVATGTAVQTGAKANVFEGVLINGKSSLGNFGGFFRHRATANGNRIRGAAALNYGDGNTLSMAYDATFNAVTSLYVGTWIVTGGTGNLAGISGSGAFESQRGATVNFRLTGALSR